MVTFIKKVLTKLFIEKPVRSVGTFHPLDPNNAPMLQLSTAGSATITLSTQRGSKRYVFAEVDYGIREQRIQAHWYQLPEAASSPTQFPIVLYELSGEFYYMDCDEYDRRRCE